MKKLFFLGTLLIILGITMFFRKDLFTIYSNIFINDRNSSNVTLDEKNEYYIASDYQFIKNIEDFNPKNEKDILNIYYSILNSGIDKFTLFCSIEYSDCLKDFNSISNNQLLLSNINNFVHPYNSFKNIETEYDSIGRITIRVTRTYSQKEIDAIENKVDQIIDENITSDMTDVEKIKTIHDYVINHSKYDSDRSDRNIVKYKSDIAYGNLLEGFGICSGYADSMKIFLDRFGIKNYKISSENHVWNLVYIDDEWLHLDLTWDDPISDSGKDILDYNFYLIDTTELQELETTQHNFDNNVYIEAN